ncbi:hypothetical protein [Vulcanisaeta thermophila]|uniref:hypothetical protein n=1 Tax=Vulcanisaeta thermophila TaxID=867917 RepID=UPI00117C5585|nr:hypothetical protein [Vulcanisaeta thermophila]
MVGVLLQTGGSEIANAVQQAITPIASGLWQAILFIGGVSFIILLIMIVYNVVKYIAHPSSWGRSAALSGVTEHVERLVLGGALGLWLAMFVIGLFITYANTGTIDVGTAASIAGQLLMEMLKEVATVLGQVTGIKP